MFSWLTHWYTALSSWALSLPSWHSTAPIVLGAALLNSLHCVCSVLKEVALASLASAQCAAV